MKNKINNTVLHRTFQISMEVIILSWQNWRKYVSVSKISTKRVLRSNVDFFFLLTINNEQVYEIIT